MQPRLDQQVTLGRRHLGFDHLADKRGGAALAIAAAAAAFAIEEGFAGSFGVVALDAHRGKQHIEFWAGRFVRVRVSLCIRGRREAIHRERYRAKALGQVIFTQGIGRQRRGFLVGQQQAQVDPAVVAWAEKGLVAAGFEAVTRDPPVRVARVVGTGLGLEGNTGQQGQCQR